MSPGLSGAVEEGTPSVSLIKKGPDCLPWAECVAQTLLPWTLKGEMSDRCLWSFILTTDFDSSKYSQAMVPRLSYFGAYHQKSH